MAWRLSGDKPLSEPMMISLLTHICITRPQWVNTLKLGQKRLPYCRQHFQCLLLCRNSRILIQISLKFVPKDSVNNKLALVQIRAWHRRGNKPLSEPMMVWWTDSYASLSLNELTPQISKISSAILNGMIRSTWMGTKISFLNFLRNLMAWYRLVLGHLLTEWWPNLDPEYIVPTFNTVRPWQNGQYLVRKSMGKD